MADITAAMVKALRERSGLPMMDCKKALQETNGDEEAAMELLRKRGAAAAEKKAGRAMGEGRIGSHIDKGKGVAAMVEMHCETAPVSNNPDFIELTNKIARHVAQTGTTDIQAIVSEPFAGGGAQTIQDMIHDVLNRIRENMQLARAVHMTGRTAAYVHHNGRVGVLLCVEGDGKDESVLNDVCMHITAMAPLAATRDDIPAATVAKEEEINRELILQSGKSGDLVDKILAGKMKRWYSEQVLIEQPFVKDDKKSVGEVLNQAGFKVKSFIRMAVGGG